MMKALAEVASQYKLGLPKVATKEHRGSLEVKVLQSRWAQSPCPGPT